MNLTHFFRAMILINGFAFLTIILRPKLYGVKLFRPMIWNFKLSIFPLIVLISTAIISILMVMIHNYLNLIIFKYLAVATFIVGLLIWITLLPNSGYLITELNLTHREMDEKEVPIWYDIISILSFALSGVINTIFNITIIIFYIVIYYDPAQVTDKNILYINLLAFIIILLVSIGIFLGRVIRFNSWDLIHPTKFLKKITNYFSTKKALEEFILFIMFHSIFFYLIYDLLNISNYFILPQ